MSSSNGPPSALITGGGRGIGKAIAAALARAGFDLAITWHRDENSAAQVAREIEGRYGRRALTLPCALEDAASVRCAVNEAIQGLGRLDALVLNAGIWNPEDRNLAAWDDAAIDRLLRVNLHSTHVAVAAASHALRSSGKGRVVFIGSTAGVRGEAGHAPYAASKGALLALARSLVVEMGPHGVTANVVSPGWVRTDMTAPALDDARVAAIEAEVPTRRISDPADIAAAVAFLVSPEARQISGVNLDVNGGAVFS